MNEKQPELDEETCDGSADNLRQDLGFSGALLLAASMPLLALDGVDQPWAWPCRWIGFGAFFLLGFVWSRRCKGRRAGPGVALFSGQPAERSWASRLLEFSWLPLLFVLCWLVYFEPTCLHFWGGYDEFGIMVPRSFADEWVKSYTGRPLHDAPIAWFYQSVSGQRVEPFLWLTFLSWFANAVLIKLILDRCFPHNHAAGSLAAVLLIAHRAEPLRSMVMWTTPFYVIPLTSFLLSVWLFLVSFDRQDRLVLFFSVTFLSVAILWNEAFFPVALVPPLLVWLRRTPGRNWGAWSGLWLGFVALLTAKFLFVLLRRGANSYQAKQAGEAFGDPLLLVSNLASKVYVLIIRLLEGLTVPPPRYRLYWAVVVALVMLLLTVSFRRTGKLSGRSSASILGVASLAILLGLAPFTHMEGLWRTLFIAAPAHAISVAGAILACACFIRPRFRNWAIALTAALLVAGGGVRSLEEQSEPREIDFQKTVHVFQQLHSLAGSFKEDTLLAFVLEEPNQSPLANLNYPVNQLVKRILGPHAGQLNFTDALGEDLTPTRNGIVFSDSRETRTFSFAEVAAFSLAADGTIRLLPELPATLLPQDANLAGYAPLDRMMPERNSELPFMHYPNWLAPFHDIVESSSGIMLGAEWGRRQFEHKNVFRPARDGATFVVNPQGQRSCEVAIDMGPLRQATPGVYRFTIGSDSSAPLRVSLDSRQTVHVPLSPQPGKQCTVWISADWQPGKGDVKEEAEQNLLRVYSLRLQVKTHSSGEFTAERQRRSRR